MLTELPREKYELTHAIEALQAFPIIASVIYRKQKGRVFVDTIDKPKTIFISHKSGFCYLYTEDEKLNYKKLLDFLIAEDSIPQYFHVYHANDGLVKEAQHRKDINIKVRPRMRLQRTRKIGPEAVTEMNEFTAISTKKIDIKELSVFNLNFIEKFWESVEDFVQNGFGWVILHEGKPVSIFYTVSVAIKDCEGDILTLPDYRGKGLATMAESLFLQTCDEKGIVMGGDVFLDNIPSIRIQEKYGYMPWFNYNFLSVFKVKN